MSFWSTNFSENAALQDPKRKFRFTVQFGELSLATGQAAWFAKTATKPSFQIASAEHKYLNHTFYYPGSVTWQDVTITLVDPVKPDAASSFTNMIVNGGYAIPSTGADAPTTTSKAKMVSGLKSVIVTQFDSHGVAIEKWTLNNAWISELKYGDLEYGADDLTEISLTLKYDWATMLATGTDGAQTNTNSGTKEFFAMSS